MRTTILLLSCLAIISCGKETKKNEKDSSTTSHSTVSAESKGYPTQVYWGDTHLHTSLSSDAAAAGNKVGIDDAYRFARGEKIKSTTGVEAKLARPLDFLVIADHSDGMGFFDLINNGDEVMMKTPEGKRWKAMLDAGKFNEARLDIIKTFAQGKLSFKTNDPAMMEPVWKSVVDAAERYNDPGTFTAFIGYEWTSLIKGNNLHRVVIYRDNADKTLYQLPYTNEDSSDPEKLWDNLENYEKTTGGRVLAIPHNGNLSNGMMFSETTISGEKIDADYAKRRQMWEPLYESSQTKGDSESHPFLSPNDEFADYETWDKANLDFSELKTKDMLQYEYSRSGLKEGLKHKTKLGVNPYKFGLICSTDSHTSLPTSDDNNFFGKNTPDEPSKNRLKPRSKKPKDKSILPWQIVASGYAAVWAQENTRTSLWDAMKRKETYGTTGPRMQVRFFGGWDYEKSDLSNLVENGYNKGVPMGGDLVNAGNKKPSFIVHALMDPEGASLDRIQIIKGWANADGSLGEKIYNVTWGGDRKVDANGKLPSVGNTVNLKDATWDNSIGATELKTVWSDPDFDPNLEAFYYVRVLEIPTPRWTLYDKVRYNLDLEEDVPLVHVERAYTSPIWYSPK